MKITVAFLLVAVSCYFDLASANCMNRCAKSCWQPHVIDLNCLGLALAKNPLATVSAMANFLCAYDRCKAMKNKAELIRALRNLMEVTQCALENILGNDFTKEELNADVDGILQYLLRAVVDLLNGLNVGYLTTPLCGPLYIRGIPSLDGRIRTVVGTNGGKQYLGTVAVRSPGLLTQLVELLLGPLTGDGTGLLNGLTRGIGNTVGGLTSGVLDITKATGDVTEGIGNTAGGLTSGVAGDITGLIGDVTRGVGNPVEGLISGVGGVTGLIGGIKGGTGQTDGGLASELGGAIDLHSGSDNRLGMVSGLIGAGNYVPTIGLTSGLEGVTQIVDAGIGETAGEFTSKLGGATDALGGVVGILDVVPKATEAISEITSDVVKTIGSVADGLVSPTGVLGGLTGVLGTGLLSGLIGSNKPVFSKTESSVGENILGNGGIATDLSFGGELGGELSGGVSGKFFARPDFRQGSSVLRQPNADTSGGLLQGGLLKTVGNSLLGW